MLNLSEKSSSKINQENLWIRGCALIGHVSFYNSRTLALTNRPFAWDRIPFFIIILKVVRLSLDFMWNGSVFQISGPRYLILLAPKVTWFIMGTSRLGLYWFRIALLVLLSSKMPFIKVGFILFTVLKRFTVQSSNVPCTFTSTFYDRLIWGIIIVK